MVPLIDAPMVGSPGTQAPEAVRVLILHDETGAAVYAEEMYQHVEEWCGQLSKASWSFDGLEGAGAEKLALLEAAHAQLLVVAAGDGRELPSRVKVLVGAFIGGATGGRERVLFALTSDDAPAEHEDGPACSYLRSVARLHGLNFICSRVHPATEAGHWTKLN